MEEIYIYWPYWSWTVRMPLSKALVSCSLWQRCAVWGQKCSWGRRGRDFVILGLLLFLLLGPFFSAFGDFSPLVCTMSLWPRDESHVTSLLLGPSRERNTQTWREERSKYAVDVWYVGHRPSVFCFLLIIHSPGLLCYFWSSSDRGPSSPPGVTMTDIT